MCCCWLADWVLPLTAGFQLALAPLTTATATTHRSTHVLVLTHPAEPKRAFSSVRLLPRLLQSCASLTGRIFRLGEHPTLDRALACRHTMLLYPQPNAFVLPTDGGGDDSQVVSRTRRQLAEHVRRAWRRRDAEHLVDQQLMDRKHAADANPSGGGGDGAGDAEAKARGRAKRDLSRQRKRMIAQLVQQLEQEEADGPEGLLLPAEEETAKGQRWLIVLDGTWKETGRMLSQNPRLSSWPVTVQLDLNSTTGEFDCRPPPRAGCVSTMEAIVMALRALDGPGVPEGVRGILRCAPPGLATHSTAAACLAWGGPRLCFLVTKLLVRRRGSCPCLGKEEEEEQEDVVACTTSYWHRFG